MITWLVMVSNPFTLRSRVHVISLYRILPRKVLEYLAFTASPLHLEVFLDSLLVVLLCINSRNQQLSIKNDSLVGCILGLDSGGRVQVLLKELLEALT